MEVCTAFSEINKSQQKEVDRFQDESEGRKDKLKIKKTQYLGIYTYIYIDIHVCMGLLRKLAPIIISFIAELTFYSIFSPLYRPVFFSPVKFSLKHEAELK